MSSKNDKPIEAYLAEADDAAKQKNWPLAVKLYQQVYQEAATFEVNVSLVKALFFDNQFIKAERVANEFYQNYPSSKKTFDLLTSVYLANQSFITARKFVQLTKTKKYQDQALEQIETAESIARNELSQTVLSLARQFRNISEFSIEKQEDILKQAEHLPLKEYLAAAKFLLLDVNTGPIIRVTLIESLQQLNYDQKTDFIWIDNLTYTMIPNQLPEITEFEEYQQVINYIYLNYGENLDVNEILQAVKLHLILMYPYLNKVLINPVAYIKNTLSWKKGAEMIVEPETQAAYRLLIYQIINDLNLNDL